DEKLKILERRVIETRIIEPCGGYSFFSLRTIIKEKKEINPSFIKYFLTAKSFNYNVLEFYCLGNQKIDYDVNYKKTMNSYVLSCLKKDGLLNFENERILYQMEDKSVMSDFDYSAVGKSLKFLRLKNGKSQGQIVSKLSFGVYQRNMISKIENMNKFRSSVPKIDRIEKILEIIHSSFEVFLFYYLKFSLFGTNWQEQKMFLNYEENRVKYLSVGEDNYN
ncbi:MAG: hypothetical protein PHD05_06065, partial [Sphaerochaetaceae bacterium]|nr:hypothetical protein [Sphaerochaetaceae bacterium]